MLVEQHNPNDETSKTIWEKIIKNLSKVNEPLMNIQLYVEKIEKYFAQDLQFSANYEH